ELGDWREEGSLSSAFARTSWLPESADPVGAPCAPLPLSLELGADGVTRPTEEDRVAAFMAAVRSICAPMRRGVSRAICWLMQHSAKHTASPPSLQSWALLITPEWMSARK